MVEVGFATLVMLNWISVSALTRIVELNSISITRVSRPERTQFSLSITSCFVPEHD